MDFLYESGLAVGKGSSGFKALESLPKADPETAASSSSTAKVLFYLRVKALLKFCWSFLVTLVLDLDLE